ncbi:MAG: MAE_28990/MAE_18760 family HEPN-like nuclease [Bacteroidota bacterium]
MTHKDLEDLVSEDWTWRKREISTLILLAEKMDEEEVVLKSIILLLYAHWEGYIKKCSKIYLKFIADSGAKFNDLTENFKAVALKGVTKVCLESKDSLTLQNELTYIKKFSKIESHTLNYYVELDIDNEKDAGIIDTQQNLSPAVFKNILEIIGLNYKSHYELKEKYIDLYLLSNRNSIGHGNKFKATEVGPFTLEIQTIKELRDVIFSIIENFRDELIEYSREKYFLKINQENLSKFLAFKEEQLGNIFKEIETKYSMHE